VLRLPFTLLRGAVAAVAGLPHLPGWRQEREQLRQQLLQQQIALAQAQEALRQADAARGLAAAVPGAPRGLIASIIGRSLLPTQQTVLLNRGAADGLAMGSVIVDAEGVIGRVLDVQRATALVLLLTDPDSRLAGLIERSRETGLLVGQGHGRCEFIYLDAEADVAAGDRLVTAGLGGSFPKGLLLGTVQRVLRDETLGTTTAVVRPAARLSRLEQVLCLPPLP
jgi:rod shape-determining protein MreC